MTPCQNDMICTLVNNLTENVQQLKLNIQPNLKDEHVKTLVSRCKRITALDLSHCKITDVSIDHIMNYLSPTLEKLNVNGCHKISDTKIMKLKSMPKLKVLLTQSYRKQSLQETENLRKLMPHLDINNHFLINEGIHLGIAHPGVERFKPKGGLWDIIVNKGTKLFPKKCGMTVE